MGCIGSRVRDDTRARSRAHVNALLLTGGQATVGTTEPGLEHLESEALSTVSRFWIGDVDLNRVNIAPHTLDVLVDPAELVARQDSWARFLIAMAPLRPHRARLSSAPASHREHWQSQDGVVRIDERNSDCTSRASHSGTTCLRRRRSRSHARSPQCVPHAKQINPLLTKDT